MSDNKIKQGQQDHSRVAGNEPHEVEYSAIPLAAARTTVHVTGWSLRRPAPRPTDSTQGGALPLHSALKCEGEARRFAG